MRERFLMIEMIEIDGVRYRPEDAPKHREVKDKARKGPANKAVGNANRRSGGKRDTTTPAAK